MKEGVKYTGVVSRDELSAAPGMPDEKYLDEKPIVIIECVQNIPCNPCETSCKFGAIEIGSPITTLPRINGEKCIGCGVCVAACPGLAIFRIEKNYSETTSTVDFPFEYLPLPDIGAEVQCTNRAGQVVTTGKVLKILSPKIYDNTTVMRVEVPKEFYNEVRSIKRGPCE